MTTSLASTAAPAGREPLSRSPWRDVPAYRQIISSRLRTTLAYRQNVFFLLAILVLQIFILRKVWTALYQGHTTVDGLTLHAMLVYITLANLQNWVLQDPTVSFYMYNRVREGQVAFDLVRPVWFVPQMFAHLVGSSFATVIFGLVALPFIFFAGTLGAPASPTALLLYLASFVLAYVIMTLLTLMLGMIAFWTTEISGLEMLYRLVNQFFAGALVPVSLFPGAIRIIADVLPFQATTYTPVALYVGRVRGADALGALGVQAGWVVLLIVASWAMWQRALHRVVVQGG
jgi:ABC-2 type transport system permease protein